ncbi:hypothetical protein LCGC14_2386770, partial [marine sediment metagenome]
IDVGDIFTWTYIQQSTSNFGEDITSPPFQLPSYFPVSSAITKGFPISIGNSTSLIQIEILQDIKGIKSIDFILTIEPYSTISISVNGKPAPLIFIDSLIEETLIYSTIRNTSTFEGSNLFNTFEYSVSNKPTEKTSNRMITRQIDDEIFTRTTHVERTDYSYEMVEQIHVLSGLMISQHVDYQDFENGENFSAVFLLDVPEFINLPEIQKNDIDKTNSLLITGLVIASTIGVLIVLLYFKKQ